MKSLLLTAAVSALALSANAQLSVIPEAGVSLANYRYNIPSIAGAPSKSGSTATNAGFRGGVNVGFGIGDHLSIQPGIFYSMKGGVNEQSSTILGTTYTTKMDDRFHYLEIPVNVVYYFGENQSGFFLSAGGYAAALLSANGKGTMSGAGMNKDETIKYSIGGTNPTYDAAGNRIGGDDFRRWDIGVQGGVGYQLRNGLMVRAQYHAGLMNIKNHNNSDYSYRNGMLSISLGYKFGF